MLRAAYIEIRDPSALILTTKFACPISLTMFHPSQKKAHGGCMLSEQDSPRGIRKNAISFNDIAGTAKVKQQHIGPGQSASHTPGRAW